MNTMSRSAYFDNAKFILIFLVVFGHTISPYRTDSDGVLSIYHFIFIFHMPVFILLAGYFSKNFKKKGYYKKIFTKVVVPYLIFQTVYTFYYNFIYDDQSFTLQYVVPRWAMWFLLSLIFWKLMLPLFARFSMWISMPVSIGLGLLVGFVDANGMDKILSLSRMLVFFPFFLLGYYLSQHQNFLGKLLTWKSRLVSAVVLVVALTGSYYFLNDTSYTDMLYGTNIYNEPGEFMMRVLHYTISIIVSFAFMALIPTQRFLFTGIGQRSLYVYLLHGFVIKWFFTTKYAQNLHTSGDFVMLTLLSILITMVLGSRIVDAVITVFKLTFKFIVTRNWSRLSFKKRRVS